MYLSHTALIHVFTALRPLKDFISAHPEYVASNNAMRFVSDDGGADYNLCICTSSSFPTRTIVDLGAVQE